MEYGYEIVDTSGNKTFFVEDCTYCSMSTVGIHEVDCPCYRDTQQEYKPSPRFDPDVFYEEPRIPLDPQLKEFYRKKGYIQEDI